MRSTAPLIGPKTAVGVLAMQNKDNRRLKPLQRDPITDAHIHSSMSCEKGRQRLGGTVTDRPTVSTIAKTPTTADRKPPLQLAIGKFILLLRSIKERISLLHHRLVRCWTG